MSIVPSLVKSGVFEAELGQLLVGNVTPGDVAIDVGANIGVFTTMLGHLVGEQGQVFAFEPVSPGISWDARLTPGH